MDSPPSRSSINFSRPLRGQLEPPPPPPPQFAFPIASSSRSSRRTRQEVLDPSYAVRSRPRVVAAPSLPPSPITTSFPSSSSSLSRDLRRLHRRQTSLLSKPSALSPAELLSLQVTQQDIVETQAQLRDRPIASLPFPLGGVWNGDGEEGSDEFGIMPRNGGGVKEGTSRLGSIAVDSLTTTRRSTSSRKRGSPVRAIHHGKEGAKPRPYGRKDKTSEGSTSPTTTRPRSRTPLLVSQCFSNFLQPRPSSSSMNKNNKRPSSPSSQPTSPPPPQKRAKRKFSLASLRTHHHESPEVEAAGGSCSAGVPAGWRRKRTRSNWAAGEEDFDLVTGGMAGGREGGARG